MGDEHSAVAELNKQLAIASLDGLAAGDGRTNPLRLTPVVARARCGFRHHRNGGVAPACINHRQRRNL